jgi:hypothetical protein
MIAPWDRRRPGGRRRVRSPGTVALALGLFLGVAASFVPRAGAVEPPAPPAEPPVAPAPPFFAPATMRPVTLADPAVIVTPGQDIPDPFIVWADGNYLMFSSQNGIFSPNVPLEASTTLTDFAGPPIDAMPTLPPWAEPGFTWAPDVLKVGSRYLLWFNAAVASSGAQAIKCIGVASSANAAGPYVSEATAPLVCQLDHLGSIDPRAFVDPDGRLWLLWKSDDNAALNGTTHSTIWIQQLSQDGLSLVGEPVALMTANLPWEGRIVESPQMVFAAGHYWLFFSGNWFNQPSYAVGVAECAGPEGPCEPTTLGPWLSSNAQGAGPGEESLFFDGSRWWLLYAPFAVDYRSPTPRPVALVRLVFGAHGPSVVAPDTPAWSAPDPATSRTPAVSSARRHCATRRGCAGAGPARSGR